MNNLNLPDEVQFAGETRVFHFQDGMIRTKRDGNGNRLGVLLTLQREPTPKARARPIQVGGRVNMVDPQRAMKDNLRREIRNALGLADGATWFPDGMTVSAFCQFEFRRPLIHFEGRNPANPIVPEMQHRRTSAQADVDNLEKFLFDVMNGVLYGDDVTIHYANGMKGNAAGRDGSTSLLLLPMNNDGLNFVWNATRRMMDDF